MENHSVKNMTRGGQVLLHNLRMINQVLNKVMLWTLPFGLLVSFTWFMFTTNPYDRYVGEQYAWAKFALLIGNQHQKQSFILENGNTVSVYPTQIVTAHFIQSEINQLSDKLINSFWAGLVTYLFFIIISSIWLKRRGDAQTAEKRIKGDYLGEVKEVNEIVKSRSLQSDFHIGKQKLPLPKFTEMQHHLVHGTTGAGKSSYIKELLDIIRKRGDRAILWDISCNLVKQFYLSEIDKLMNPLDKRGVDWSIWKECKDKADFENLAAAQIPMPPTTQDPFWINAARTIFAAAAFRMRKEKNPKIIPLLRYLLTADIQELQSLLKGTEAESLMSEKTEKTAISIKSVLATYLKSLCYVKDDDNPFSIRDWVRNDNDKSWLFISSSSDKHEALKPLITCWLDIAINTLLSLPENKNRRIWVILDELASLHKLPYLSNGLAQARKFGGCFVIGIQSIAQASEIYGSNGAKNISSLLNTRIMFRTPDEDIAAWSARNLGQTTIEEVREGISYGANTMRDGVSVNRVETKKPVVDPSEIMRLDDLTCYIRLPGSYPITKINIPYVERPDLNVAFDPRVVNQNDLSNQVFNMAESIEADAIITGVHPNQQSSEVITKNKVEKIQSTFGNKTLQEKGRESELFSD